VPEKKLDSRIALVTGGSSGIGRGVALRLAEDGAAVVVADVQEQPLEGGVPTHTLIQQRGGRARYVPTDVSEPDAVRTCVDTALEEFGGLHIAFCGAGVVGPVGDSTELDIAEFDRHFAINVRGAFLAARAALRHFTTTGYGRVVLVSSTSGLVGVAQTAAYCASKAAVIGLARSLAAEFGQHGITVNALCPGATQTAMGAKYRADPEVRAEIERMTPIRLPEGEAFVAEPADIASVVAYVVSDEARFMTGSCVVVDGGLTAL
jgi:NAD(P)-dependent dehydrogenase (short-subunit alcohol dehydrogenase family)